MILPQFSRPILALLAVIGIIGAVFISSHSVLAETYGGGSVTGYASKTAIDNGTIVQLNSTDTKYVEVATQAKLESMFGVTVDRNQLPITLTSGDLENEVFVAVSGTYSVLVSTQGGSIAVGDYITMSSVNGIGMKASTDDKTVFGRAVGKFDGKGVTLGQTTLKDTSGNTTKTVALGSVPVTINIQHNPNEKSTKSNLPEFLQRVGLAIAEKEVSPIRIYLSVAVTILTVIAAIVIIYSGIRNSVISIGRNPMSRRSIFRALLEVILTSLLILIVGLFAVYLLLKL